MKKAALTIVLTALVINLSGQKLSTRSGKVKFFSDAKIENIEAINKQVSSVMDLESGKFAFLVPIRGFVFEKALMQEHFNENYMESDQYPNATFKGRISNTEAINLKQTGEYQLKLEGKMKMHGVENPFSEEVTLTVKDEQVHLHSQFYLKASDYQIEIPAGKKDNINNRLEVTVNIDYDK
jgi:hypothetical protein